MNLNITYADYLGITYVIPLYISRKPFIFISHMQSILISHMQSILITHNYVICLYITYAVLTCNEKFTLVLHIYYILEFPWTVVFFSAVVMGMSSHCKRIPQLSQARRCPPIQPSRGGTVLTDREGSRNPSQKPATPVKRNPSDPLTFSSISHHTRNVVTGQFKTHM